MNSEAFFSLFLVFVAIIGCFWLSGRGDNKPSHSPTQHPPSPPSETKPRIVKPVQRSPERFDATTSKPAEAKRTVQGTARIVDGDTIVIQKTQIRLFGIDAPELNHPYGKNAKWALVALCKGQKVKAEIVEVDHFGRTVAKCYLPDGRDLSGEMVKKGLAIDWPKFSGGAYSRFEVPDARRKMWLADARQKGRLHAWEKFEARSS